MLDTNTEEESSAVHEAQLAFELPLDSLPERLDKVLARLVPEHSRSRLQSWIEAGHVLVNGVPAKVRQSVGPADQLLVFPQPGPAQLAFQPEAIALDIVAQSPDWVVLNKPAGLVTHPGAGNWSGTLLNGLLHHFPELAHVARAGIVHRLDKDTSGLLVVARNEAAQTSLVRQLQARSVKREYLAMVHGEVLGQGTIDRPIGRDPRVPVRMTVTQPIAAKPAMTHYQCVRSGFVGQAHVSTVLCRLETGRTHQIRVHLQALGHPLLGDVLYGGQKLAGAERQMLHARRLAFDDMATGERVEFQADPPGDFAAVSTEITWTDSDERPLR
ncbi:RluA family pseudouridine synthase [Pusillimonas sp. CC-YST705]|uniref:Pseudouridine synthase n=1 Tax=Mesopusillimonas faecipullorum TaxID=2755040 RepID=A0ABS8CD12_9BURK|nr:RluA family pseudouridine synthase [Mesopusillimonas faecipullorum]MCB5363925.1 RluA family pseudouridine synthase [Mesopusillimonas faecipullorum]